MVDPNSDYSRLQSSRIQDSDDHRMSRVTCQPSHRPLHLRSLEEASRAPSKQKSQPNRSKFQSGMKIQVQHMSLFIDEILLGGRKPSKQSASHQHTKSQTRTTSRETACHSNELSHPPYRRPRSKASQELRQVRAKQNELEENAQHYGLWGEIKYLIKSAILGRAERKAYAARQQQREQRAAARARAEKAALPTPICSAKRSHNLQRRNSHDSIIRPQPAVTRSKKEVPPKAYPSVHRKPVPKRTEPRPDISEDTSDPHRATLVKQDPSRHQSVHLITHMASTASSFDSKKVKLKYGPDKRQDRVTQLGDFMGNPEEVIPPVPPKDTILTNTKPSSPKLAPCSVCGALPGLESGFTWTATNLWLCPTCVDPIRSPFEAPPSPKPHHNSPHHTPTSTKISSIRDSVIQKHCSPLSELALRGRCYSDVSAQDALSYNDDGCVSPLGEWEHGQIDMSARMPPTRAHPPTYEKKGKAPAPRLPP